jgi:aspartate aminotransferase-like enzyme
MSQKKYKLLAPGPVMMPPEVYTALSEPMVHHRIPEFEQQLRSVLDQLKDVFSTTQPVLMHVSTGSGAMESALVNTLSPGDTVIAIVSGKFGERWAQMAEAYGMNVIQVDVEWGQAVDTQTIEQLLEQTPHCKAVLCQASETSTGVLHPIQQLGPIIAKTEALFLVDAITAVGATALNMDDWNIDVMVAGSQKVFMLPTGLSFIALSEKAWRAYEEANCPKYYWDLLPEKKANQKNQTRMSSAVSSVKALAAVLPRLTGRNKLKYQQRCQIHAEATREFIHAIGLTTFTDSPSPALTVVNVPEDIDGNQLRQKIETEHLVTFMGGQDHLKGKIIRIGHIGYISNEDATDGLSALVQVLQEMGHPIESTQLETAFDHFKQKLSQLDNLEVEN